MQKRENNNQIYEQLDIIFQNNKPWSKEFAEAIDRLDAEPDYPMDDPVVVDLIKFSLGECKNIDKTIANKTLPIEHILEINFSSYDTFQYDLLATYLYDLSNHLQGLNEPHPSSDEIKSKKVMSLAKLVESLAAVCANNAQLLSR